MPGRSPAPAAGLLFAVHRVPAVRALLVACALVLASALVVGSALIGVPAEAAAAAAPPGPVVVVGIDGAAWSAAAGPAAADLPQLRRLADRGAVGSLSVRTAEVPTCPVDGWLTVSAGRRAVGPDRGRSGRCPQVPTVAVDPTSVPVVPDSASGQPDPRSAGRVRGWDQLRARNADSPFAARIGTLSTAVSGARSCVTAVGPGAALAAAGPTGDVDSYVADPARITADVLTGCAVTIVDAGPSPAAAEPVLARVTALLPAGATLLVVGVDDGPVGAAGTGGLRVAAAVGPGFPAPGADAVLLDTDSTRWPGLVQLTDVAPTVLAAAGIADRPATFVGSRWTTAAGDARPAATLAGFGTDAVRARVAQDAIPRFYAAFGIAAAAVLGAGAALGRRSAVSRPDRGGRPAEAGSARRRGLAVLRATGLVVAAAPLATRLASLLPWADTSAPGTALAASVTGWSVAVAAVAGLVARVSAPAGARWRRAAALVAGATVAGVAVDLVLGSPLQRLTVIGLTPIQGGRFYGMGNEVFAATGMCALFGVAVLAARRPDRAVALCAAVGIAFVALDGLPVLGADFGGVPASVVGFGVAALVLSPVRPRAGRVLAVAVAAAAVLLGAVVLDLTRPPDRRTHVGAFAADLLSGSGGDVVARKAAAATGPFLFRIDSPVASVGAWLAVAVLLVLAVLVARPRLVAGSAFAGLLAGWPQLRACLLGAVAFGAVGFALNDSGVAVPVIVCEVAVGLVVASMPFTREVAAGPGVASAPPAPPEPRVPPKGHDADPPGSADAWEPV